MLSVKQGGIKYHFLSLWYDSTWDWTRQTLKPSCQYPVLKRNPILKTERKLLQILNKNKDLIPQKKYRQITQQYSKLPHMYGLPKIHKYGIPLRPIVNWTALL